MDMMHRTVISGSERVGKPYKAVVVAMVKDSGIMFAKRSDSVMETDHIIFDSIGEQLSNTLDDKGHATILNFKDGLEDWVTSVGFYNENGELVMTVDYKVCFDD